MKIIGTDSTRFIRYKRIRRGKVNTGSYFYALEIENNILPELKNIDLTIITTGASLFRTGEIRRNTVVVCHDNRNTLKSYSKFLGKNCLWICSKESTAATLRAVDENAVYIPLSIDVEYVKQFRTAKTKDIAFVGNAWGFKRNYLASLPSNIDQLSGMGREQLLNAMAQYKRVIAEGRCLMEAQVLGAQTEVPQYEDGIESVYVEALDNRETIPYWRLALETFADIQKRAE